MKLQKTAKIVLILVITFITSATFAQQRGGGQGGGQEQGPPPIPSDKQIKKMVSDLGEEISLNEEQEEEVLDLYTAHFKQIKAKTNSGKPNQNEMEKLKTEFEKEVKTVLTDDQQKAYTAYLKKQGQNKKGGPKRN